MDTNSNSVLGYDYSDASYIFNYIVSDNTSFQINLLIAKTISSRQDLNLLDDFDAPFRTYNEEKNMEFLLNKVAYYVKSIFESLVTCLVFLSFEIVRL
jgi:hypothetical protein